MQAEGLENGPQLKGQRRLAMLAAGVGTFVEFFDYASYSYLATTIAVVFFPLVTLPSLLRD